MLFGSLVCVASLATGVVGMWGPASPIETGIDDFREEEREIARAFYSDEVWRNF